MRQVVRQLAERVDSQMDKAAKAAKGGKDDGRWAALLGIDLIEAARDHLDQAELLISELNGAQMENTNDSAAREAIAHEAADAAAYMAMLTDNAKTNCML